MRGEPGSREMVLVTSRVDLANRLASQGVPVTIRVERNPIAATSRARPGRP
jgi:hypothetical protein